VTALCTGPTTVSFVVLALETAAIIYKTISAIKRNALKMKYGSLFSQNIKCAILSVD